VQRSASDRHGQLGTAARTARVRLAKAVPIRSPQAVDLSGEDIDPGVVKACAVSSFVVGEENSAMVTLSKPDRSLVSSSVTGTTPIDRSTLIGRSG
jgi:hypothetical protein